MHAAVRIRKWTTRAQLLRSHVDRAQSQSAGTVPREPRAPIDTEAHVSELLYRLQNRAVYVGTLFDRWQMHSLLLACAFLPWTAYYWSLDRVFGDHRYYWSTLTVHVLWGFTWFRLSVPLFRVARRFNRHRSAVATALVVARESTGEFAKKVAPISTIRVAIVAAASVVTFVAPLLGIKS